MLDIDFIIPWVDGSDPNWIAEFNKYAPKEKQIDLDVSKERYRDYGLLKYWFRGVEKFAPWVRKVHFVTCGQKPEWLNVNAPKLHWVKHSDYIPAEYLPVFSSHPIEIGMRAIPDLAEHFVYFNDDCFLTAPVKKDFFFRKGLPCDVAALNSIPSTEFIGHIVLNDLDEINRHFSPRKTVIKNIPKWLNPRYGFLAFRTVCLLPWSHFSGFYDPHFAQPYTKSMLEEVWRHCDKTLTMTMNSRFRNIVDVNQWLFRYWQLCTGRFAPSTVKDKKFFSIDNDIEKIVSAIRKQKYAEIALNDADCADVSSRLELIKSAFEQILPEKSSFEI